MRSRIRYGWDSTVAEFPDTRELMNRASAALSLPVDDDDEKERLVGVAEDSFSKREFKKCEEALIRLGL